MRKETCYLIAALVIIVALSVAFIVYTGRPLGSRPGAGAGSEGASGPGGGPAQAEGDSPRDQLTQLGITGEPSLAKPKGLVVTSFVSSSGSSPLEAIGVKVGDKIVSCNGQQERIAARLVAALDGLQNRGEPVVLVVVRRGEKVRLERTEKLPGAGSG